MCKWMGLTIGDIHLKKKQCKAQQIQKISIKMIRYYVVYFWIESALFKIHFTIVQKYINAMRRAVEKK